MPSGSGRAASPICPDLIYDRDSLIGTLRRECLVRVLIFDEAHLRQILTLYGPATNAFYRCARTHRLVERSSEQYGTIAAAPVLSGVHHYAQFWHL